MCIFIAVDLCFCHRELTSKEHTLNINRLAKRNDISTHTANAFTHDRMRPHGIICIDIQRFQIDIINCCFFFVTYFDFQEFTHEMISVIHGNFHGNIPVYTVFGNGLKREFYHDSAVRIYFFNFAAFQSHLAGSDHGTCICCTDCFAVHLYFCRRCPCLTVRLWWYSNQFYITTPFRCCQIDINRFSVIVSKITFCRKVCITFQICFTVSHIQFISFDIAVCGTVLTWLIRKCGNFLFALHIKSQGMWIWLIRWILAVPDCRCITINNIGSRTVFCTYFIIVLIAGSNCPVCAIQLSVQFCCTILAKFDNEFFGTLCRCKRQICPLIVQFCRCQLVVWSRKFTLQIFISDRNFSVFHGDLCFSWCRLNSRSNPCCWNTGHYHGCTQSNWQPLFFFLFQNFPPCLCNMHNFIRHPPPRFL